MFCPKCGQRLDEGTMMCGNCGYNIPAIETEKLSKGENCGVIGNNQSNWQRTSPTTDRQHQDSDMAVWHLIGNIILALAVIVLILSFISGGLVFKGGIDIAGIESVGGKTLEEAYYQYSGSVYFGYAVFIVAAGIAFSSVLAFLGIRSIKKR